MEMGKILEINGEVHEVVGGQRLLLFAVCNLLVAVSAVVIQHV